MARIQIDGRAALDRDGVSELTGKSRATVKHWDLHRDETGFPSRCNPETPGKAWYWEDDVAEFWEDHQQAKSEALTEVNRDGDPDELVGAPQVLAILGYTGTREVPPYLVEHPDETKELPSRRLRRRWKRLTVWEFADNRVVDPAAGRPAGTGTGPHVAHPYADDPRLDAAIELLDAADADDGESRGLGVALARQLGVSEVTAGRLLKVARQVRAEPPA